MGRVAKKRKKLKTHDLFDLASEEVHNDHPDHVRKKKRGKQRSLAGGPVAPSVMGFLKPSMFLNVARAKAKASEAGADAGEAADGTIGAAPAAAPAAAAAKKKKPVKVLGGKGQKGGKVTYLPGNKKKAPGEHEDIVDDTGKATGKLRRKNIMKERKHRQQEKKRGLGPRAQAAAEEKLLDFKQAEVIPFNTISHRPPSFKFKGGAGGSGRGGVREQTGDSTIAAARLEAMAAYKLLKQARSKQ
jgi:hypothetical protein